MAVTNGSDAGGLRNSRDELSAMYAEFDERLTQNLQLCAALEDLADRLPSGFGTEHCRMLVQSVRPTLRRFHDFEEKTVFPLLRRVKPDISETLERLSGEHFDDCSFAEEIEERLQAVLQDRSRENVDSFSYMLRGLFGALRRHIAFEREYLLPQIMSASDHPRH